MHQGEYALLSHRVHIPLIVPRCIRFEQVVEGGDAWSEVPMKESEAFEVNNKLLHKVL